MLLCNGNRKEKYKEIMEFITSLFLEMNAEGISIYGLRPRNFELVWSELKGKGQKHLKVCSWMKPT